MLDHKQSPASRTLIVRLALPILAMTCGICISLYLGFPWLVARIVPLILEPYGFTRVNIDVGYPGWRSVSLDRLQLGSDQLELQGTGARIDYSIAELLAGHLAALVFEQLDVSILIPNKPADQGSPFSADQIFVLTPLQRLSIRQLRLEVPEIGFVGTGSLDLGRDELAFNLQGIAPEAASHFNVIARLLTDNSFSMTFTEQGATDADYLTLQGTINDDVLSTAGNLRLSGYALELCRVLFELPPGKGVVSGDYQTRSPWPLPESAIWQGTQITVADLKLDWLSTDGDFNVSLWSPSVLLNDGNLDVVLDGQVNGKFDAWSISLQFPSDYLLHYRAGQLEGASGPQLRISKNATDLLANVQSFTLRSGPTPRFNIETDLVVSSDAVHARGSLSAQMDTGSIEHWSDTAQGSLEFSGEMQLGEQHHQGSATLAYQLDADTVHAKGTATTQVFESVNFDTQYHIQSGAGELQVIGATNLRRPMAKALMAGWAEPYDLDGGRVTARINLGWSDFNKIAGEATLVLEDGRAHYDVYRASGIAGSFRLHSPTAANAQTWSLDPVDLNVARVDIGFPVSDLSIRVAWLHNQVNVLSMHSSLLGGHATAQPFVYDIAEGLGKFDLTLESLDLSAILALEGDDISGTGRLSGTLPVSVSNNVASVQGGKVSAAAPGGVIQLSPTLAGATGQAGLDFALVALQDLRYSKLDADIDYSADGNLALAVHLLGHNPVIEKGRPIQYNLKINENLPALLESLRVADELTRRIERQVSGEGTQK